MDRPLKGRKASSGWGSLRTRLLIILTLAMLPMLTLILWGGLSQRSRDARAAERDALHIVRLAQEEYGQGVNDARQLLHLLAQLPQVRNADGAALNLIFSDLLKSDSPYTNIAAVDANGDMYASAIPLPGPVSRKETLWFQRAIARRDFVVGDYQVGVLTGKSVVVFAYPVFDEGGPVRTVLAVPLDLEHMSRLLAQAQLPAGSTLAIVDSEGTVLARAPDPGLWIGKSLPEAPAVKAILEREQGTGVATGLDGVPRLYGFAPLTAMGGNDLYVNVGIPKQAVFGEANAALRRNLALGGLSLAALLLLTWAGSQRFFIRPVRSLIAATRRMAAGDLSGRTGLSSVPGEVGELARAYDEMAGSLEARQTETQRLTRLLSMLNEVNQTVVRTGDLHEVFNRACQVAVEIGGFRAAWVGLVDNAGGEIRPTAWAGEGWDSLKDLRLSVAGDDAAGVALDQRHNFVRNRCEECPDGASAPSAHSFAVFPLQLGEQLAGAIGVYAVEAGFFQDSEVRLLQELAGDISFAVERAEREALRRQAEERARALGEHLQRQVDRMPIGLITWTEQFTVRSWNPAAEKIFGFSQQESLGKHAVELVVPKEAQPEVDAIWSRLLRGDDTAHSTNMNVTREGRTIICEWWNTPLKQNDGKVIGVMSMVRDVTDQKKAEEDAVRHLRQISVLYSIDRAAAHTLDLDTVLEQGFVATREALEMEGGAVFLLDEDGETLIPRLLRALSEEAASDIARVKLGEGITGRAATERKPVIWHAGDSRGDDLVPLVTREGLQTVASTPLISGGELLGVLTLSTRRRRAFYHEETDLLTSIGQQLGSAVRNARLHQKVQQELAERQRTDVTLRESNQQLQKALADLKASQQVVVRNERLRAFGEMASGIAHDINNGLTPVVGYADILLTSEPHLSENARNSLELIKRAGSDISKTVARLREFYRQRDAALEFVPVLLNEVVEQAAELTLPRWKDMAHARGVTIQLALQLDPQIPLVMGDEVELREAVMNLVFNSVDAMPSGGALTLRTATQVSSEGQTCVTLEVVDTGLGMDSDTRQRCLEPFFTTKGEHGTGLGLSMVYGTVQRHSGNLEIESQPGKGATVRLSFPAADLEAEKRHPTSPASGGLSPKRVLLIDDDPTVRFVERELLASVVESVDVGEGGQAGLDLFRKALEAGRPYDIVVTDLGMPGVDGKEVARAIKKVSPATPVVLLTGWATQMAASSQKIEAVDYLLGKPVQLDALRRALIEAAHGRP